MVKIEERTIKKQSSITTTENFAKHKNEQLQQNNNTNNSINSDNNSINSKEHGDSKQIRIYIYMY